MNLQLSLKTKWFEMTKAGIKTEDYREINPYWASRLFNKKDSDMTIYFWQGFLSKSENNKRVFKFRSQEQIEATIKMFGFKNFITNTMTLGYPKGTDTERIIKFEHKGIEIRTGNPDWGAEPDKLYFVIKHGRLLE
jgi:hypothetical protein